MEDKLLDGELNTSDFQRIKTRNELEIGQIDTEIQRFNEMKTNFEKKWIIQ